MVMVILAIASALLVPALRGFAISRASDSAAMQVLTLSQYARTAAVNQGQTYRMNFDTDQSKVWLTMLDPTTGTYVAPPNDFGTVYTLPSGMRMSVSVVPQPTTLLMLPTTATQTVLVPTPPYGQPVATDGNPIIQVAHDTNAGVYMEFQPSGRVDPAIVKLTDKQRGEIDLGCQTSTESMHVLSSQEMR